jgi:dUTP pyrophosphatase
MKLLLKTENTDLTNLYSNHQHYNPGDSGLDLFCPETITINPGETVKINLQINCEALNNENTNNVSYYLYPRSSIIKTPLRLANSVGIIDAGYRGDIIACVDNIKLESYTINKGDRLFQICAGNLEPIEFQLVNELSNTQRGSGGFGSTGQ